MKDCSYIILTIRIIQRLAMVKFMQMESTIRICAVPEALEDLLESLKAYEDEQLADH